LARLEKDSLQNSPVHARHFRLFCFSSLHARSDTGIDFPVMPGNSSAKSASIANAGINRSQRTGLLLVNLGSPDAPTSGAVRSYLREFLCDSRVIDIPALPRWLLVNLIIAPFRAPKSAHAYQKVWTDKGSPLVVNSLALVDRVREACRERDLQWEVELGMRYGKPSIAAGLRKLEAAGCDKIILFPLYPHYAASSTGTALAAAYRELEKRWNNPSVRVVAPFYDHPAFIHASAQVMAPQLKEITADHVLFSFHGLPERHLRKSAPPQSPCLAKASCCDEVGANNRWCYRAQCMATARELASALTLQPGTWSVSFQSRLGRDPWILPETTATLRELREAGSRRIAVACPAFVADCLETLEEIGIRAHSEFLAQGGEACELVTSLNAHPAWVEAVIELAAERALDSDLPRASQVAHLRTQAPLT
jgi:ferrochelatase